MTMVTGLFKDHDNAERACQAVIDLGYDNDDINVVMSNDARQKYFTVENPTIENPTLKDAGGLEERTAANTGNLFSAKLGGPSGATAATLAPAVAAAGVLLIPGLGLIAGPVAVALAAAGAVGIAGGIVGILTNWGIPTSRVKEYNEGVIVGGILLGVKTKSDADAPKIQQRWQELGGQHVHS